MFSVSWVGYSKNVLFQLDLKFFMNSIIGSVFTSSIISKFPFIIHTKNARINQYTQNGVLWDFTHACTRMHAHTCTHSNMFHDFVFNKSMWFHFANMLPLSIHVLLFLFMRIYCDWTDNIKLFISAHYIHLY